MAERHVLADDVALLIAIDDLHGDFHGGLLAAKELRAEFDLLWPGLPAPGVDDVELRLRQGQGLCPVYVPFLFLDEPLIGLAKVHNETGYDVDRPRGLGLEEDQQLVSDEQAQVIVQRVQQHVGEREQGDVVQREVLHLRVQLLDELKPVLRLAEEMGEDRGFRGALALLLIVHALGEGRRVCCGLHVFLTAFFAHCSLPPLRWRQDGRFP